MSKIYSYVVAYDSGFAPNPFHGFCTLATCKPVIRRVASIGDWIVGTGSNRKGVRLGGSLVYAMRVCEDLSFTQYWNDHRFQKKKPEFRSNNYTKACGDNIYCQLKNGRWEQLSSYHSREDGSPHQGHIRNDTCVNRVLISRDFVYFGGSGPEIPDSLKSLVHQHPGHKKCEDSTTVKKFEDWIKSLHERGYRKPPFEHTTEKNKYEETKPKKCIPRKERCRNRGC